MKLDHILIGIDFSAPSFEAAHWIARHVAPGAKLVLAHVIAIPEPPPIVRSRFPRRDLLVATVREGADKRLRDLALALKSEQVSIDIREGEVAPGLLEIARERSVDALVVGTHGEGAGLRVELGSTAERLVRDATTPVLLAAIARERPPERILVPVDHSDTSGRLLRAAHSLGGRFGAQVVALHVVPSGVMSHVLAATAAPGRALQPTSTTAHDAVRNWLDASLESGADEGSEATADVVFGEPAQEIVAYAERWDSDLIVIGRRGAGGLRRAVLGSVVDTVLHHAPCPVLVLPEDESR